MHLIFQAQFVCSTLMEVVFMGINTALTTRLCVGQISDSNLYILVWEIFVESNYMKVPFKSQFIFLSRDCGFFEKTLLGLR